MRLSIVIVALVGAVSVAGCSRFPKAKGPNKGLRVCEAHRANKALQGRRASRSKGRTGASRVHKAHRANRVFQDRRGLKEQRANKVCPDRKAQRANKALRGHKGLKSKGRTSRAGASRCWFGRWVLRPPRAQGGYV